MEQPKRQKSIKDILKQCTLLQPMKFGKLVSLSERQLVDCDHEERAGEEAIDMEDFFFEGIACHYKQL
ncbi:hypothetical protein F0562_011821 [Nyssa sinensis]|uniref:Uncharacterized protein n=1 Tax=Nyssa sinensis TaxID=561372 RepID=A0A5J4ZU12_9ASTE|nr:hypothetical protein F0562_011821 [Nyssa sinensis]